MSRNHHPHASRLSRWLGLLTLAAAAWTGAAIADTYVVLSLVGDRITIVGQGSQTGSRFDQNQYRIAMLTDLALDDFAVHVVDATIAKLLPNAVVITLRANDPALYSLRDSWVDTDAIGVQALVSSVTTQLATPPDAHLVLIMPYKDQPDIKAGQRYRGTGKVAGLGLYLDAWTRYQPRLLGAFANFQIVLIGMRSSATEAHERVVVGTMFYAAQIDDGSPWVRLTRQQASVLEFLVKREIERVLPGMLSSPRQ